MTGCCAPRGVRLARCRRHRAGSGATGALIAVVALAAVTEGILRTCLPHPLLSVVAVLAVLPKDAGAQLLAQAVRAAASGDALIAPNVTVRLIEAFAGMSPAAPPPQPPSHWLLNFTEAAATHSSRISFGGWGSYR